MRCAICGGKGVNAAWEIIVACMACRNGFRACPMHACQNCDGSGLVCPRCCGMRFLRIGWPNKSPDGKSHIRCPECTEGNNVNQVKERAAIQRYLAREAQS